MTDYVGNMEATTREGMSALFQDVNSIAWVDFPDHANVGDSAIALGQAAFFRAQGVNVNQTHCIGTLPSDLNDLTGDAIVINGGGNIAGHYDKIDRHRNRVFQDVARDRLVIQAPQSIHFTTEMAQRQFKKAVVSREAARFAIRDHEAATLYASMSPAHETFLVPDAVHLLGELAAPSPVRESLWLVRADAESNQLDRPESAVDWPRDDAIRAVTHRIRWRAEKLGAYGRILNPSPQKWETLARRRLARGIALLSAGEVVVTDRLHAMLLALQMGRRVVALDNANRKLSKYAETWFEDAAPRVTFVESLQEARREVSRATF